VAPLSAIARLMRELSIPPLLAQVVWGRGLQQEALEALTPPLKLSAIPTLPEAAARLEAAIRAKRRILIHGDYDADGISGTALLTLGLRALGAEVIPFIPNRQDGYGIASERVPEHAERAALFLTVDCGISNLEEIAQLQALGVEVIVSDHHHPGQALPDCLVIHPALSPLARQGLPELTGAGVAFHLLWALHERLGLEPPLAYSDLAAIGTIADVAPLLGENRALVKAGLIRLADSQWPGVRAAVAQAIGGRAPSAREVAFVLAPRLNAAGRLGEAEAGLELLMTASERRGRELAAYLDIKNAERRAIQDAMFKEALAQADPEAPALVLHSDTWHPGVMGIVASKVLERFYKPVFIIAQGKGSVRSTPGISAVEGLAYARAHLKRFGGHSQAAGFSLDNAAIAPFRARIFDYARQFPTPQPTLMIDALISRDDLNDELFQAIKGLEPYGQGHPPPLFALTAPLEGARAVGEGGKHLQLRLAGLRGVAWQQGHNAAILAPNTPVNAAIHLHENHWQERRSLELIAAAVRPAQPLGSASSERPLRYRRGQPQDPGAFTALPLNDAEPLALTAPLRELVSRPEVIFALDEAELARLMQLAAQYPSVHDLRRAFVALSRRDTPPFNGVRAELCRRCLLELELIDQHGRARNLKRDPYRSETLMTGLIERYLLQSFVSAYRFADDATFDEAVRRLLGMTY